mmetsp:Transcript_3869/g.10905  ORF Transcript_3869/g.10905 Transcript_3869/m.10905 type:complete len:390 (-) Transcript_3869:221-1390(-)
MSRDDHSHGIPMIARQLLSVHFVRQNDFAERINCLFDWEGPAVRVSGLILVVPFQLDVLDAAWEFFLAKRDGVDVNAALLQDIAELDAAPFGGAHGANHPMRTDEDLVIAIVQIFTTISGALESGDNFVLWQLLEVLQSEFVLLHVLARDDQSVLLGMNVRHGQMASRVEEFIGRDVSFRKAFDLWLSVEWLQLSRQQIRMALWIGFEHVSKFKIGRLFDFFWWQISDAVLFHPIDDMATKMLAVHFPIWLQVLPGRHHETRSSARMTVEKEAEIVHAAAKGVPHVILLGVFGHFLHRVGRQIGTRRRMIEFRFEVLSSLLWRDAVRVCLDGLGRPGLGCSFHARVGRDAGSGCCGCRHQAEDAGGSQQMSVVSRRRRRRISCTSGVGC